ncbi:MAG: CHAT domain-containing protein [Rhodospirillales bacterium]
MRRWSGALDFLGQTLAQERPEALHLSCHGDIDAKGTPVVVLETPAGGAAPTSVGDLAAMLGDEAQQPALIFLSACRTAEHGTAAAAYTQALVRAGIANALGWDGSVYDADAITFAEVFYAHLGKGRSVAHAAAQARRALLLLNRNNDGDSAEVGRLLGLALADARRLRIPEAGQIEAILQQHGLPCPAADPSPAANPSPALRERERPGA